MRSHRIGGLIVSLIVRLLAVSLSWTLNSRHTYTPVECEGFLYCCIVPLCAPRKKERNENDKRRYPLARESCRVRIESGVRVRRDEGRIRDV